MDIQMFITDGFKVIEKLKISRSENPIDEDKLNYLLKRYQLL